MCNHLYLYTMIPAPMTNDKLIEMIIEIKPTARFPFSISSSTLKLGVKNSKIKYPIKSKINPYRPQPSIVNNESLC